MQAIEDFTMRLTVSTDDFCFVRYNAAFVLAYGAEEVEAANLIVRLNNQLLFITIVEVVSNEPAYSMSFQLVHC